MSMETSLFILVILLSSTLFIFLVAAIVFMIKLIQVTKTMKEVSLSAKNLVGDVEGAASFIKRSAAPAALVKMFVSAFRVVQNKKSKKGE